MDAVPPARLSTPRVWSDFRRPFGTVRPSDFCWAIDFRSLVLRPTARAEPNRSRQVRHDRLRTHPVAHTHAVLTDFGLHRWGPAHPLRTPYGTSLSLETVAHLRLPPDLRSRARQGYAHGKDLVIQINALVSSVSGSLRWAPGLDFHLLPVGRAGRTPREPFDGAARERGDREVKNPLSSPSSAPRRARGGAGEGVGG